MKFRVFATLLVLLLFGLSISTIVFAHRTASNPSGQNETLIFSDNFEQGSGNWNLHWGPGANGFQLVNDNGNTYLGAPSGESSCRLLVDKWMDFTLKARFKLSSGALSFFIHYTDDPVEGYDIKMDPQNHKIQIFKDVNFVTTTLTNQPLSITFGDWHNLQIATHGNNIEVYIDNTLVAKASDNNAPLTVGDIFISSSMDESNQYSPSGVGVDDLEVWGISTDAPLPGPQIISGMVTDSKKTQVPGVTVSIYQNGLIVPVSDNPQTTDGMGKYSFNGLKLGDYMITAVYLNHTYSVNINYTGGSYTANIALTDLLYSASVTPVPLNITDKSQINVKAWIDGSDYLYIQGNSAWFVHRNYVIPNQNPTYLNGDAWYSQWPDVKFDIANYTEFQGLRSIDTYKSPVQLLPSQNLTLSIEKLSGNDISIVQQPSIDNGYTAVILFDDDNSAGAQWYEANIIYPTPAIPATGNVTPAPTAKVDTSDTPAPVIISQNPAEDHGIFSGNFSGITMPTSEKTVAVMAPVIAGVFVGFFWPWLGSLLAWLGDLFAWLWKLLGFVYDGVKSYLQKLFSVKEAQLRDVKVKPRKKWLFGISRAELLVGIACALLVGITFTFARDALSDPYKLLVIIIAAALTIVVSELVRRYFASRYLADTEYQFWGVGALTLVITAFFHQPFSRPARTIIDKKAELGTKKLGIIAMAPCVASLTLSIIFLLLMEYGNGFETLGKEGFKMGMMICVYSLMPFEPMDGKRVIGWSKAAWGIVFIPALLFYLGMLLFVF